MLRRQEVALTRVTQNSQNVEKLSTKMAKNIIGHHIAQRIAASFQDGVDPCTGRPHTTPMPWWRRSTAGPR